MIVVTHRRQRLVESDAFAPENGTRVTHPPNAKPTPIEMIYQASVQPGAVWGMDFDRLVCPRLPACDPIVNTVIVKRDSDHITGTFAATLADPISALLYGAGLLPERFGSRRARRADPREDVSALPEQHRVGEHARAMA